jgi:FAD/FMN-containing dehydrogenase
MTDEHDRYVWSTDLFAPGALPRAVLRPGTVEELQRAVAACTREGYALMPRGGGLTYVGGYAPPHDRSVVMDLRRLDRIVTIAPEDMYVTVEAGVTWKQLHDALRPHGLRTPFFGTFSGRGATIGGGLSNGALFFGTARYGSAADVVLGLAVVLADGRLLYTGQASVTRARKPFFRSYGPDLTGLFTHDSGAFGIKALVTLRLIRAPRHTGFLSFEFGSDAEAIAALSEVARAELAEEAYVMDPVKTQEALGGPTSLREDVAVLGRVLASERGVWRRVVAGSRLVRAGRRFIGAGRWSLHVTCANRSGAALTEDLGAVRDIAYAHHGREVADTIPRATRATLFPPLEGVVGARGERWVALNAKVAHSDALGLVRAADALVDAYQERLQQHGVTVGRLLTVMSTHAFSFEPVFSWPDAWLPLHRQYGPAVRSSLTPNEEARGLVVEVRARMVQLFAEWGAASSQLGRTYPYLDALRPESRSIVVGLKSLLDPHGVMNPGVLGLGGIPFPGPTR